MSLFTRLPWSVRFLTIGSAVMLASGLSYLSNGGRSRYIDTDFLDSDLYARVHVLRYNHGLPVVRLPGIKRPRTLALPLSCSAYVRTGDSLAKQRGVNLVRVLRDSSGYRVMTEWASFQDPHRAQLVGRQCVLLNPTLETHAP